MRTSFLFSILLLHFFCNAQESNLPLQEWKSKISARSDIGFVKQNEVQQALLALDSNQICRAMHWLQEETRHGNERYRIRVVILEANVSSLLNKCRDLVPSAEKLEQNLRYCYELSDNNLAILMHQALANTYFNTNKLGLAVVHNLAALELSEKEGLDHFDHYALNLYATADLLYRSRDYPEAARLNKRALQYHGRGDIGAHDSLNNYWKMNTWNNLGLCYKRMMQYDSAMYAYDNAFRLTNDPFWRALIQGNRGDVFSCRANTIQQKRY